METVIVILIVAIAAIYVGRVFYRGFVQKKSCACGCSGCDIADACGPPSQDTTGPVNDSRRTT